MVVPGILAVSAPVIIGFLGGAEMLGGLLAGVTSAGVLMAIFQSNAGGAWDNAKKMFEEGVEIDGKTYYKGSEPHKAAVVGDTVGDPFKDTSGPSLNILLKLMSVVALVIAPSIALDLDDSAAKAFDEKTIQIESVETTLWSDDGVQEELNLNEAKTSSIHYTVTENDLSSFDQPDEVKNGVPGV